VTSYLGGRLLALVPVLLVVATVVFLIARLTPGDPVRVLLGEDARPEQVEALRKHFGLDAPLPVRRRCENSPSPGTRLTPRSSRADGTS
jgi:peptide/nickel transport system permease protein